MRGGGVIIGIIDIIGIIIIISIFKLLFEDDFTEISFTLSREV